MVKYESPKKWFLYDHLKIQNELISAKSAVQTVKTLPYQRSWVEKLQQLQLKREVAGTSRIEGAEFTEREFEIAVRADVTPEQLLTRSQQQANSAMQTYRWLSALPDDRPFSPDLILEIHRRIVTGCDDDHCPPGVLRSRDHNVTFGIPRHRGVEGGIVCERAFSNLLSALHTEGLTVDPLIQALAVHYHLAAMHPFLDGNGRTARAAQALALQRAGLTDRAFIAMSNYYYEEKAAYLSVLSETRAKSHDLTQFLLFGLRGIRLQCEVLTSEIRRHMQLALFRDTMYSLFNRLETKRKRVIGERQIGILKVLFDIGEISLEELRDKISPLYEPRKFPTSAYWRDLSQLWDLGAVTGENRGDSFLLSLNLNWPQEIDEGEFLRRIKNMPKGKSFKFLG